MQSLIPFRTFEGPSFLRYNAGRAAKEVAYMEYVKCGDYYIPNLVLEPEPRPFGRWGRLHRDFLKEYHPIRDSTLLLSGKLWTYLADLNEQATALCNTDNTC